MSSFTSNREAFITWINSKNGQSNLQEITGITNEEHLKEMTKAIINRKIQNNVIRNIKYPTDDAFKYNVLPNILTTMLEKRYTPLNTIGSYTFSDGTAYTGELQNGKPHGKGVQFSSDGDMIYNGFWMDGQKDGYGINIDKQNKQMTEEFYRPSRQIPYTPQESTPSSGEYYNKMYQLDEIRNIFNDFAERKKAEGEIVTRSEKIGGKKKTKHRRLKKNKTKRKK